MKAILGRVVMMVVAVALASCGGGGGGDSGGGSGSTPASTPAQNPSGQTQTGQTPSSSPVTAFQVSGAVSGINPSGLTGSVVLGLTADGAPTANDVTVSASGGFTFPDTVPSAKGYSVIVKSQPAGQNCAVSNGTGTASANVTNVSVSCQVRRTVRGGVSDLNGPLHLALFIDGGSPINLRVDGPGTGTFAVPFAFPAVILPGQNYLVMVSSGPLNQDCSVSNGTGVIANADVTNVSVSCTTTGVIPIYRRIGGMASGTSGRASVTVQVDGNLGPAQFLNDGSFTLAERLTIGQTYTVRVTGVPPGQTCSVSNGSGVVGSTDITNVSVVCSAGTFSSYSVGGTVSGLNGSLVLRLIGSSIMRGDLAVNANGAFTFVPKLVNSEPYKVIVQSQPTGQVCTVANGAGLVISSANVTDVAVVCSSTTPAPAPTTPTTPTTPTIPSFTVGGTLSGMTPTTMFGSTIGTNSIALAMAFGSDITQVILTSNGGFAFSRPIPTGQSYSVFVRSQPSGQTCTIGNAAGVMGSANISNVSVVCTNTTGTTNPPPTNPGTTTPGAAPSCPEQSGGAIGGLGFFGTESYSDLSTAASTLDPSIAAGYNIRYSDPTVGSGSFTGSLRVALWAVSSSFSGGTLNGFRIATFTPNFVGTGAKSSNQLFNGATVTGATSTASGTTPPAGSYCMVIVLDEFTNDCGTSDGYCYSDWLQFPGATTFQ
jgi:large repetitive protein